MTQQAVAAASPARQLVLFTLGALAALIASVFIVGSALGMLGITDQGTGMAATSIVLGAFLLLLSRRVLRAEGAGLADLGVIPSRARLRQLGFGLSIGTVLFLAVAAAQSAAVGARWDFLGVDGLRAAIVGLLITTAFVLVEELLFRGVLLLSLRRLYGDRGAVVLSALLFGAYHLLQSGNWAMGAGFTFVMPTIGGLLFGWAAIRSKGLALPIGLHLGGNWVQASLAGFGPVVESTSGSPVQALWRIPISAADVSALTAPDLLPHLPNLVALALAAPVVWKAFEGRQPAQHTI